MVLEEVEVEASHHVGGLINTLKFLRPLWSHLRVVLDPSQGYLGPSRGCLELLGSSWCVFVLSWASLGPSWGCLGPLLGLSWAGFTLWDEHGAFLRGHWEVCSYM